MKFFHGVRFIESFSSLVSGRTASGLSGARIIGVPAVSTHIPALSDGLCPCLPEVLEPYDGLRNASGSCRGSVPRKIEIALCLFAQTFVQI